MASLKVVFLIVVLFLCSLVQAQKSGERVYIRRSDSYPLVSIYSRAGLNWKNCEKNAQGDCKEGVGWLDSNSKIWTTGEKRIVKVIDPWTEKEVEEEYYEVEFEYDREYDSEERDPKTGKPLRKILSKKRGEVKAWIESAYLSKDRSEDHPYLQSGPILRMCTKKESASELIDERTIENLSKVGIEQSATEVFSRVGMCTSLKDAKGSGNLYDSTILHKIKAAGAPQSLKKSDGTPVTPEDLVEIDSLARTIYGEMASCFKYGIQYPMAVARIALNRVEFSKKLEAENANRKKKVSDPFIQGPHDSRKTHLAKVVTSPLQFNAWLKKLNSQKNPAMMMALCPARDPNQKLLDGRKPLPTELLVWKSSVKIATDAVLNKDEFLKKTSELKDIRNYTSDMGKFYGMKKQKGRKVAGLEIKNDRCVELWKN